MMMMMMMMMMMFDLCPLNSSLIQAIVIFDQNNSILHADDTIQLFTIG